MEDEGHYKEWYYDDELGTWQIAGYVLQDEFIKFLTVKGMPWRQVCIR